MNLTETMVVAVITVSVAGTAYTVMDPAEQVHRAEVTADRAACRTVDAAIVAYVAENGVTPSVIADLEPYVRGDITAYRIEDGVAAGPGCPTAVPS